jgi:hypothetical protein
MSWRFCNNQLALAVYRNGLLASMQGFAGLGGGLT